FFFFKQKTAYEIFHVTGVQTCALPILMVTAWRRLMSGPIYPNNGSGQTGSPPNSSDTHRRKGRVSSDDTRPRAADPIAWSEVEQIGRASCRARESTTDRCDRSATQESP